MGLNLGIGTATRLPRLHCFHVNGSVVFSLSKSTNMAPKATTPRTSSSTLQTSFHSLINSYNTTTSPRLKLIDAFLVFIMFTGIVQFLYCVLVTNYPFNAFLAGYVLFARQDTNANYALTE